MKHLKESLTGIVRMILSLNFLKRFITKPIDFKAFLLLYMCCLVMSPYSCDSLVTPLYIQNNRIFVLVKHQLICFKGLVPQKFICKKLERQLSNFSLKTFQPYHMNISHCTHFYNMKNNA